MNKASEIKMYKRYNVNDVNNSEINMKNFEWCVYTYKHRLAFEYVARKLIKDEGLLVNIIERARVHDLDKQLMYLFLDWDECVSYHIMHQPHHLDNDMEKSYEDLVETIIDFECAPYTKPDKPLNAFDFVGKLKELGYIDEAMALRLFSIMRDFEIDYSYDITKDEEAMRFVSSLPDVTEEMILLEIMEFVNTNPVNELSYIREKMYNKQA